MTTDVHGNDLSTQSLGRRSIYNGTVPGDIVFVIGEAGAKNTKYKVAIPSGAKQFLSTYASNDPETWAWTQAEEIDQPTARRLWEDLTWYRGALFDLGFQKIRIEVSDIPGIWDRMTDYILQKGNEAGITNESGLSLNQGLGLIGTIAIVAGIIALAIIIK